MRFRPKEWMHEPEKMARFIELFTEYFDKQFLEKHEQVMFHHSLGEGENAAAMSVLVSMVGRFIAIASLTSQMQQQQLLVLHRMMGDGYKHQLKKAGSMEAMMTCPVMNAYATLFFCVNNGLDHYLAAEKYADEIMKKEGSA